MLTRLLPISIIGIIMVTPAAHSVNKLFMLAQTLAQKMYMEHDLTGAHDHISRDLKVTLKVNGKAPVSRNYDQFFDSIENKIRGNVEDVRMLQMSFEMAGPNTIKFYEHSIQKRKGTGIDEDGEGTYDITDTGFWTFREEDGVLKLVAMEHEYQKTKHKSRMAA
ncbi:MAG: hypothetical protein ACPGXY_04670 [Alphaproteobacteria bacterium]